MVNNRKALEEARHVHQQQTCAKSATCEGDVTEMEAIIPTTDKETGHREDIKHIDYKKYEYDFENIVFEGGGAKGIVYAGALEVSGFPSKASGRFSNIRNNKRRMKN
mgnify:CR=1 FL=1